MRMAWSLPSSNTNPSPVSARTSVIVTPVSPAISWRRFGPATHILGDVSTSLVTTVASAEYGGDSIGNSSAGTRSANENPMTINIVLNAAFIVDGLQTKHEGE